MGLAGWVMDAAGRHAAIVITAQAAPFAETVSYWQRILALKPECAA